MNVYAAVVHPGGGVVIGAAGRKPGNPALLHEVTPGVWCSGTAEYAELLRSRIIARDVDSVAAAARNIGIRVLVAGKDKLFDMNHEQVQFTASLSVADMMEARFETCASASDAMEMVRDALQGYENVQIEETTAL